MTRESLIAVLAAALLGAIAVAVYAPTFDHPFVDYGDRERLLENPEVRSGLTGRGMREAFTSTWEASYTPLAWLSHMLDFSLFGGAAGDHHRTNVALHALNVVLLFLLMRSVVGGILRPALVALLFAVHPIHVETVAWVSERTGLLSTSLGLAALWCHASDAHRERPRLSGLAFALFVSGMLAKPMLVSLPFLRLLADAMGRSARGLPHPPMQEQLRSIAPWLAVACVGAIVAYASYGPAALGDMAPVPLFARVAHAFLSSVVYLWRFGWPVGLSVFYPHPALPGGTPWGALDVLVALSIWCGLIVLVRRLRDPIPALGLTWFVVALLPVSGLVQFGNHAMADRFAYLPAIGVYVAAVFAVSSGLLGRGRASSAAAGLAVLVLVAGLAWIGRAQIDVWRSSETLFRHAASTTLGNYEMHLNLGNTLKGRGRIEEAIEHYEKALEIYPEMARAHFELANTLLAEGQRPLALVHYRAALASTPDAHPAKDGIARLLVQQGDLAGSLDHFRQEVERNPESVDAHVTLGNLLRASGDLDAAAAAFEQAARLDPDETRWQQIAESLRTRKRERPATDRP